MLPSLFASPIRCVPTEQPSVALTFDDGPHATYTGLLLELFAREEVRVTFFEIGNRVAKHPESARALVAAGHEIGNHSMTHANLAQLTNIDTVRAEVVETQNLIRTVTGVTPRVFRPPFLAQGPELCAVLAELGLPSISSDVATKDWDTTVTKELILERAQQAGPGDIVLMHTWSERTLAALPEIIARLRAKGLRFVSVSELLALA